MVERKEREEEGEKKKGKKREEKSTKMESMTEGRITNGGSCANNSLLCLTSFFLSFCVLSLSFLLF